MKMHVASLSRQTLWGLPSEHARILACFGNPHNILCLHLARQQSVILHRLPPNFCGNPSFFCVFGRCLLPTTSQTKSPRLAPGDFIVGRLRRISCSFFFPFLHVPGSFVVHFPSLYSDPELSRRALWNIVPNPSPSWIPTLTRSLATRWTSLTATLQRRYVCCALPSRDFGQCLALNNQRSE